MIWVAILTGVLAGLIVRRATNASALREVTRKIQADLLEFRLYFDEPRLIWRAQMNLVRDNLRLFLLLLPAASILALPMGWLVVQLDAIYGLRPLRPGEGTVFTVQLNRPLDATDRFELQGRAGVRVETPPVRAARGNQVAWRIRPVYDGQGALDLTVNGQVVRKTIMTGDSTMILSPRRSRSLAEFLMHPEEPRLPEGDVAWLAVDYSKSDATIPWLVWFLIVSTTAAWITGRVKT